MKILITGSSGMIGSALAKKLKNSPLFSAEAEIIGVDIFPPKYHDLPTYTIDLTGGHSLPGVPTDVDLVVHLAANARVYNLVKDPLQSLHNVIMTFNVLEWCRINGVKRLLFASSRETYGNQNKLPVKEECANQRKAESAYTASKIAGEAYCHAYVECYGIDARIVRFSNVYGKYDTSDRFIPKLIRTLAKNEPFTIYGERKTLDFTHIDDCSDALLTIFKNWDSAPKELNIASGKQIRLMDVARYTAARMNSQSEIKIGDTLTGEVWNYEGDISKIKSLGWSPKISLKEGIEKSLRYYRSPENAPMP